MIQSFPPIIGDRPAVLVLGTMPSMTSLAKHEYYGHIQNAFWPILFALWDMPNDTDYAHRCAFAIGHHIALWDVAMECNREGSTDQSITDVVPNDISSLLAEYPTIRAVFLNGGTAHRLYKRHNKDIRLPAIALPSTSAAYTLPFNEKQKAWQVVCDTIEKR